MKKRADFKHSNNKPPLCTLRCALLGLLLCATTTCCLAETYSYDNAGRLTKVVYDDGSSLSYQYDANSNRLTRTVALASSSNGSGGSGGGGGGSLDLLSLLLMLLALSGVALARTEKLER